MDEINKLPPEALEKLGSEFPGQNGRVFDPRQISKQGRYFVAMDMARDGEDYCCRGLFNIDPDGKITVLEVERIPPKQSVAERRAEIDTLEGA